MQGHSAGLAAASAGRQDRVARGSGEGLAHALTFFRATNCVLRCGPKSNFFFIPKGYGKTGPLLSNSKLDHEACKQTSLIPQLPPPLVSPPPEEMGWDQGGIRWLVQASWDTRDYWKHPPSHHLWAPQWGGGGAGPGQDLEAVCACACVHTCVCACVWLGLGGCLLFSPQVCIPLSSDSSPAPGCRW